jgi:tetratricopeptide (TPR) repeat protein
LSVVAVLFGITVISSAQTLQEVAEVLKNGSELNAAGDLDGAIAELEKCVEMAKKVGADAEEHQIVAESALPNLYLQKATKINATRDYPATVKALEAAIAASEKYNNADVKEKAEKTLPQVYYAMGAADFQAQKFSEAILNLDQVIARDPNMASAYFIRGASYQSLKDEAKMEENYKLAIEKGDARGKAQLTRYYNNAGATSQKAQKWDDAIAAFKKTIEVDSENSDAYYSLSSCYNSKKSWNDAISAGEKALELRSGGDPKTLDGVYYQLGTAYAGKNDAAKACENFKKVANEPFLAGAKYQIETALKCK